jgi:hypothetical protein
MSVQKMGEISLVFITKARQVRKKISGSGNEIRAHCI